MNKLKEVLRKEFIGWKKWEILWIVIATAVVLGVSIY